MHVCLGERQRGKERKGCSLLETKLVEHVKLRKLHRLANLKNFVAHTHMYFR